MVHQYVMVFVGFVLKIHGKIVFGSKKKCDVLNVVRPINSAKSVGFLTHYISDVFKCW